MPSLSPKQLKIRFLQNQLSNYYYYQESLKQSIKYLSEIMDQLTIAIDQYNEGITQNDVFIYPSSFITSNINFEKFNNPDDDYFFDRDFMIEKTIKSPIFNKTSEYKSYLERATNNYKMLVSFEYATQEELSKSAKIIVDLEAQLRELKSLPKLENEAIASAQVETLDKPVPNEEIVFKDMTTEALVELIAEKMNIDIDKQITFAIKEEVEKRLNDFGRLSTTGTIGTYLNSWRRKKRE